MPASSSFRQHGLRLLRAFLYAFNIHSMWLILLSCTSVAISLAIGLTYNVEFSFVALGITFPLTFNITQAFTRREKALNTIAELKATCIALYWQHRDWCQDEDFPNSLGNDRTAWATEFANVMMQFLSNMERYMLTSEGYESLSEIRLSARKRNELSLLLADTRLRAAEGDYGGGGDGGEDLTSSFITRVQDISGQLPSNRYLKAAYQCLSEMAVMNEYLTFKAKYLRGGEGGMSRSSQFLRYMMASMEQLRMIKIYRTPFMLRHCTNLLIHLGAVVLGPYFAHIAVCDEGWVAVQQYCPAPYVMAVIYSIICMLLLNVQASAEMPFDGSGLDDVFVELTGEFSEVLDLGAAMPYFNDSGACFDAIRKTQAAAAAAAASAAATATAAVAEAPSGAAAAATTSRRK